MNYREALGLNYSTLVILDSNHPGKAFSENPFGYSSGAMNKGSLVDCFLTHPETFEEEFIILANTNSLSEAILKIVKAVYIAHPELDELDEMFVILQAKESEYGSKWSNEVLSKKLFNDEAKAYYKYLKDSEGKMAVSDEEYYKAKNVVDTLHTHDFTKGLFVISETRRVEFQFPVFWEEDGIPCKGLLDMIIFDDLRKIIQPLDLKIKTDSKFTFSKSFMQFKYYLQAVWYTRGLKKLYPDYTVRNFAFVVTNFDYPDPPLIYRCTNNLMHVGWYGGVITETNQVVKGAMELLNDYRWYLSTLKYQYPRKVYERQGIIELDPFKKPL